MKDPESDRTRGRVALILASSSAVGILLLTAAALLDVLLDAERSEISPAYAAILTTTLGVVVGGLVGYIGGTVTHRGDTEHDESDGESGGVDDTP